MDEVLLKQLVRQVKILNFWVSFFGVLIIATLVIAGIFIWKAVTYIHHVDQNIQNFQSQTTNDLNAQKQLCSGSTSNLLKQYTTICK